jgi:hypothetical protein
MMRRAALERSGSAAWSPPSDSLVDDAGHSVAVALRPGREQAREALAVRLVQLAHQAEVQQRQLVVGRDEDVPGCRSACTKPSSKIIFISVARPRRATRFGSERVARVARIFVPVM